MIAKAREAIGRDERVELEVRDLLDLELDRDVDAIFSNANVYWILDHNRLFARLFAALRPGGALEAQCGGQDNVAEFVRAIESPRATSASRNICADPVHLQLRVGGRHPGAARPGRVRRQAGVARQPPLRAVGAGAVRACLRPRPKARAPARASPRRVRRRGAGLDAAAARARLRPTQHLRPKARVGGAPHRHASRRRDRPGDRACRRVAWLDALGDFEIDERLVGGASIDAHGIALADEVLEACREADAVLLGAVGGPGRDTTDPTRRALSRALLALRKGLGLYANLRPVKPSAALVLASPLREERIRGTDLLVVRELTGGIYFGESGRDGGRAFDTISLPVAEIERIARVGFDAARERDGRVTSVDKANVLETSRLWRRPSSASRPATPTWSSTTCWSTTPRCSLSPSRRAST